jgi:hypothetical protein
VGGDLRLGIRMPVGHPDGQPNLEKEGVGFGSSGHSLSRKMNGAPKTVKAYASIVLG